MKSYQDVATETSLNFVINADIHVWKQARPWLLFHYRRRSV